MFGVGSSGLPSDWALFDVDGNNGEHRDMTRESLDIILKIWEAKEPLEYKESSGTSTSRTRCTACCGLS